MHWWGIWLTVFTYVLNRTQCSVIRRGAGCCGEASLTGSTRQEKWVRNLPRSLVGALVLLRDSVAAIFLQTGRGERPCGWSAAMHRLRTTIARLWPFTAAQTAQSLSQNRAAGMGLRTFQPKRHLNASVAAEPFLNGTSSNYVEEMYYAWLENPRNVHKVCVWSHICVNDRFDFRAHTHMQCDVLSQSLYSEWLHTVFLKERVLSGNKHQMPNISGLNVAQIDTICTLYICLSVF